MSSTRAPGAPTSPPVPEPVTRLLRDLVHERTGTYFESDRLDLMVDKLQDRVTATGSASLLDYYYKLKYDDAEVEWRRVMDAFSVQETYFWREVDQIKALTAEVVPAWFRRTTAPLRIWSAACATGEEPYTIAMALEEAGWGEHPIEIIASDASESALAKAREAVFRERSFRTLPAEMRAKYFERRPEGEALARRMADRVRFRWANLVDPKTYSDIGDVQVVFCRNVFIYFSPEAISRVVAAFGRQMPARGYLFVGASESLLKLTTQFDLEDVRGAFAYVKKGGG
jgi:Methylase of chemotaxis methyl-accepting proteins